MGKRVPDSRCSLSGLVHHHAPELRYLTRLICQRRQQRVQRYVRLPSEVMSLKTAARLPPGE